MIATLLERQIATTERQTGESAEWMRDLFRASRAALFKFFLFVPASRHAKYASPEAHAVARIVADKVEDCGPCVQIVVNFAVRAGVDRAFIEATLDGRPQDLPDDLALVYRYAHAVATAADDVNDWVERLRAAFGDKVLAELAMAIAMSRVYPAMKRGLGHARSCRRVTIMVPDGAR
jgi:hypothetical protein